MNPTLRAAGLRLFQNTNVSTTSQARSQAARLATARVNDEWQVTDLVNGAASGPEVIFSGEEIDDVGAEIFGKAYTVTEPDEGQDANEVMQAAEQTLSLTQLMPTLRNLLHNPDVQRACVAALRKDANFNQVMRLQHHSHEPVLALPAPTDFQQGEAHDGGLGQLLQDLGTRLRDAGQAALKTAVGARTALGRFLINCGATLHSFLGQPFSKAPIEEVEKESDADERADIVGQALITVAVAILSLVLLKRLSPGAVHLGAKVMGSL